MLRPTSTCNATCSFPRPNWGRRAGFWEGELHENSNPRPGDPAVLPGVIVPEFVVHAPLRTI